MAKVGQKVLPKQDKENATKWYFRPGRFAHSEQAGNPCFYITIVIY